MTLGEKIKKVRVEFGLTQEQFSEKLFVSRQAVSKWESDRGLPDVTNLQQISSLFNVSIDSLLKDDSLSPNAIIREAIDFENAKPLGRRQSKYDAIVKSKYPDAAITHIIKLRKYTPLMKVIDILTLGTRGLFDYIDDSSWYYLVRTDNKNLFVNVTKEHIESREYVGTIEKNRLVIGNFYYVISRHIL